MLKGGILLFQLEQVYGYFDVLNEAMEWGRCFTHPKTQFLRWIWRAHLRLGFGFLHPDPCTMACCGEHSNQHIG